MSDRPDISQTGTPGGDDALAAEYALGLLEGAERADFERRLREEQALRAQVTAWEAHFAALADDLPAIAPRAATRDRVLSALGTPRRARRWRWAWVALPSALAVAVAAFLILAPVTRAPSFDPTLQASLATEDGGLLIEARYAPDGSVFRVERAAGAAAPGRDLELWVIGPEAEAPVSLGVLPPDREATFALTAEIAALIEGGVLAVSDEPEGGSPTGAPTGDILATAAFSDV